MKKLKFAFWIVLLGLLGLIVYQNREVFFGSEVFGINLLFAEYRTPDLPILLFFAIAFILGWLIAFAFGALRRFRDGKTIKKLQDTIQSQKGVIDEMQKDIAALKPQPAAEEATQPPEPVQADSEEAPSEAPAGQQAVRG